MAVFTNLESRDVSALLAEFDIGALRHFEGISAGIENTNYFVDTDQGRYVLTVFEKLTAKELPFYLGLMEHLAHKGFDCPAPHRSRSNALFTHFQGKPLAFVRRLKGRDLKTPNAVHCEAVGQDLARMHLAGRDFAIALENPRGLKWWSATAPHVVPHLNESQRLLLESELQEQIEFAAQGPMAHLPTGPIHADLFRDNVLFDSIDSPVIIGGFIDFYFGCTGAWAYDLAITINDWCIEDNAEKSIDPERLQAMRMGYESIRPLTPVEQEAMPMLLRGAALRFWISRLDDWHRPRAASLLTPKDPRHFEAMLIQRRSIGIPS